MTSEQGPEEVHDAPAGLPSPDLERVPTADSRARAATAARRAATGLPFEPRHVLALQSSAGNQAVARLLLDSGRTIRRDQKPPAPKTIKKTAPDGFLLSRLEFFKIGTYSDVFVVQLDRKKNPWHAEYTPDAVSDAALVALVRHFYETDLEADKIYAARRRVGTKISFQSPPLRGGVRSDDETPEIQPNWTTLINRDALDLMAAQLALKQVSSRGEQLEQTRERAEWLSAVIVEVAQRWGAIKPRFSPEVLRKANLTEPQLFALVTGPETRRLLAQHAAGHSTTKPLVQAFNAWKKAGSRSPRPDSTVLDDDQWAAALVDIGMGLNRFLKSDLDAEMARRQQQMINDALRPHEFEVADPVAYIAKTFDPNASAKLDFLGPVVLKGGQTMTNAKGHRLLLLTLGAGQVIYQDETEKKFYTQSYAGIENELRYGVFALTARNTRYLIPVTQFALRVLGAIFPVVQYVYTASTVLHAAAGLHQSRAELERHFNGLVISRRNIEKIHPGLFDAALTISAAGKVASQLFSAGKMVSAVDEWLIAAMKILMRKIAKAGAKRAFAGPDITPVRQVFLDIKPMFDVIAGIVFWSTTLARPIVSPGIGGRQHGNSTDLADLVTRFVGVGLADAEKHARAILARQPQENQELAREFREFGRHGIGLVDALKDALAW